jgi:hypothetical protein
MLAAALTGVAVLAIAVLVVAGDKALVGWVGVVGVAIPPLAIGAAILRYRLYDLDHIISRALAYGLLTVLLGGGYAGLVLGLGQVLGQNHSLVVARPWRWPRCSSPARRRIQQAVDRRFNRRRSDAARTIQAFSTRLRDQIDLNSLSTELLAVVDQTMEPTRVSLWLRLSPADPSDTPPSEARPTTWAY